VNNKHPIDEQYCVVEQLEKHNRKFSLSILII